MDRFIGANIVGIKKMEFILKSNMDRFIEYQKIKDSISYEFLKSNMDRFIELQDDFIFCPYCFKIQYG